MSTELISGSAPSSARPRQYGRRQQNPVRRYAGITVVLLLHIFLIWALTNGLANKVVQIVQKPIETRIIAPVKPPPPPPIPTVKLPAGSVRDIFFGGVEDAAGSDVSASTGLICSSA